MEVSAVAGSDVLRVDGGVEEADGGLSVGDQLLVDERDVSRPHRRGEAGASVLIGCAGGLIGTDVEGEVSVGRDVGAVAIGGRTFVAGVDHARELLPGRNRDLVGRNAAAAVGPSSFRSPGASGTGGSKVGTADRDDVGIIGGPGLIA